MPANFLGSSSAVDIDGLLSHTTQFIEKKGVIQDAIFASNPVFYELKTKGRVKASGGERVQVNLMYGKNSTAGSYSRYDVLDISPQDGLGAAYFPWAQESVAVSIDGLSILQNAGPEKIKDLISSKMEQATMSVAETMNEQLWDAEAAGNEVTGNSGKNILSIPMLVDADPDRDTAAIGGLNPSTYAWWNNQAFDYGASNTFSIFKSKLNHAYNTCQNEGRLGGGPDLIVMDQQAYENYEASLEDYKRYMTDGEATAGFESLRYKRAKIVWDDRVPDPEYNSFAGANYDNSNWAAGAIYLLNTKFIGLYVLGGRDWKWGSWEKPVDQDAKVNTSLWAGQLVTSNRRKHGVIYGVTATIPTAS